MYRYLLPATILWNVSVDRIINDNRCENFVAIDWPYYQSIGIVVCHPFPDVTQRDGPFRFTERSVACTS